MPSMSTMSASPSPTAANTHLPSEDQIEKRLFPPFVSRRIEVVLTRSYTQMFASFPLSMVNAIRLPSGETRGC